MPAFCLSPLLSSPLLSSLSLSPLHLEQPGHPGPAWLTGGGSPPGGGLVTLVLHEHQKVSQDSKSHRLHTGCILDFQSWALEVFFNFFTYKKWFFAFFIKLIWLGGGFLNRTGAEIGYELEKKYKNHFLLLKISKIPSSVNFGRAEICFASGSEGELVNLKWR